MEPSAQQWAQYLVDLGEWYKQEVARVLPMLAPIDGPLEASSGPHGPPPPPPDEE